MGSLKKELEEFEKQILEQEINENADETKLQELFEKLAPTFLYGGYIKVRDDYEIYIRTVEFYFHSEKDGVGIKDPIVYHRNDRDVEGDVPYFPFMTIHAHASGLDITFEKEKEYRASALIRSYEVKDIRPEVKDNYGKYLKWDKTKKKFVPSDKKSNITQSTYLYTLLNGFALGEVKEENIIKWNDYPEEQIKVYEKVYGIDAYPRINVAEYMMDKNGNYIQDGEKNYKKDDTISENEYKAEKEDARKNKRYPKYFISGKKYYRQDMRPWRFQLKDIEEEKY
ncbi:MAG: hypothetical protein J6Y82_12185 [Bacteroidales bacterium]|nr:hypothetical protein [Bacteroidales bacterium]